MSWRLPLPRLRRRDRAEAELDAELRDHVERQAADHVRAGITGVDFTVIGVLPAGFVPRIASALLDGRSLLFAAGCLVAITLGIGCLPLMLVRNASIDALLRRSAAVAGRPDSADRPRDRRRLGIHSIRDCERQPKQRPVA